MTQHEGQTSLIEQLTEVLLACRLNDVSNTGVNYPRQAEDLRAQMTSEEQEAAERMYLSEWRKCTHYRSGRPINHPSVQGTERDAANLVEGAALQVRGRINRLMANQGKDTYISCDVAIAFAQALVAALQEQGLELTSKR